MTRLRRGGLMVLSTLAAVALSACKDGFFFEPASTAPTPIVVQYAWTNGTDGVALAGAPEAFDKADGAQVSLTSQDKVLFEGRVALEPSGSDKKLTFQVDMPAGQSVSAQLEVTLVQGQTPLFQGAATASLTPGQPAEVTLPLNGVVNTVALNATATTLRIIGGTFKLVTTGVFASGDTLGPVAATYQALGSAVSVASDGTVTAVSNGTADVRASYLGKTATVTVTVDDRCMPGPLPAFGTTVTGVLDDLDCRINQTDNRVGDWYTFTVNDPVTVKFSLSSSDYVPRWWLYEETGPGRYPDFDGHPRAHQLDANPGFEAITLPAGTYRLVLFSHFDNPNARGSYTLTSQVITDDNAFACPTDDGKGTLWLTPGYEGYQTFGTECQGNTAGDPVNQDRYAVYLEPGVEYVFRTAAPAGYEPQIFLWYETLRGTTQGAGTPYQELRYTAPGNEPGWHGFTVSATPTQATGPYYVWFDEASKVGDPCSPTPLDDVGTISGTLTYATPCYFQNTTASSYYSFTVLEETTVLGEMTAGLPTNWGIVDASGPVNDRHRYATGFNGAPAIVTLPPGDYNLFVSANSGNLGPWSLTTSEVGRDESVPCTTRVHILPGFLGTQSLDGGCQTPGGQNQDRYRVRLKGGQQYSVSVVSDNVDTGLGVFTTGGEVTPSPSAAPDAETSVPVKVLGPGRSNAFTFTAPAEDWYIITVTAAGPGQFGTYTFSLTEGGLTGDGSLSGTVTADGTPLPGVSVVLTGPTTLSTTTNASGAYSFAGIPLGAYSASLGGLPSNAVMDPVTQQFVFSQPGTSLTHNFTGTFGPAGTVSGTVTVEGAPLPGVTVTLGGPVSRSTTTNSSGAYSFTGLPAGAYQVTISGFPTDAVFSATQLSVTLASSSSAATADFAGLVLRNSSIQGHVLGDGGGLPGVTVTAVGPEGTVTTTTDALGNYAFTGLRDGNYTVTISGFMVSAYIFSTRSAAVAAPVGGSSLLNFQGVREGDPLFNVSIVVSSDPNNHEPFIQETTTTAFHVDVHNGNHMSIFNTLPDTKWVAVAGTVNPDGTFNITGQGTVAGFPNVDVIFVGTVTHDGSKITGVTGTLTMGPGTQLPADGGGNHNPAIYTVTGTRSP